MCTVERELVLCVVWIVRAIADIAVPALVDAAVGFTQTVYDILLVHDISKRKTILCINDAVCRGTVRCRDAVHYCLCLKRCSIGIFSDHDISSFDFIRLDHSDCIIMPCPRENLQYSAKL